jgi:hypothetical protein
LDVAHRNLNAEFAALVDFIRKILPAYAVAVADRVSTSVDETAFAE